MSIFVNVSGTWKTVKKVFTNISGTWKEAKTMFANISGTWKKVHSGVASYTFTSNSIGSTLTLASLFDAATIAANTDFAITVPAGITVQGPTGAVGANGSGFTCSTTCAKHHCTRWFNPGGAGGVGGNAFNFSGVAGKNISIINNGTVKGGAGGKGGKGANPYFERTDCCYDEQGGSRWCYAYAGAGGAGGAGGGALTTGSNTVTVIGTAVANGVTGAAGAAGSPSQVTAS